MPTGRLSPQDEIPKTDSKTIGEFWSWAYSDILSNKNRGVYAEYLVAVAMGCTDSSRVEWDAVDIRCGDLKIEVKASAYCQSWHQAKPSRIEFGIGKTFAWNAQTDESSDEKIRSADVYVFCLFPERDAKKAAATVLDPGGWKFYVVGTDVINERFGNQDKVALSRIQEVTDPVRYDELRERILKHD